MLERVQQETDISARRLIYGFPQQMASLRDIAAEFLTEIFRPSRLEARPCCAGSISPAAPRTARRSIGCSAPWPASSGSQRQADHRVQRRRAKLFPQPPRARGGVRGGRTGQPRPEAGTAAALDDDRGVHHLRPGAAVADRGVDHGAGSATAGSSTISTPQITRYQSQYAELAKRGPQDTDLRQSCRRWTRYETCAAATPIAPSRCRSH